jgi:ribosomal protein S18 acetylase RimI-like enzyme
MDNREIQFHPAGEQDAGLLLSIVQAAFAEYRDRLEPPSGVHHETIETIRHKLETGYASLAYAHDQAAGCVFYQREDEYVYLGRLSVLPAYRRQGVGRALIEYVEAQAVALELPRVQLGVRLALPQLAAYYQALGYRVIEYGTHPGYPQPTYAVMEKVLGQR